MIQGDPGDMHSRNANLRDLVSEPSTRLQDPKISRENFPGWPRILSSEGERTLWVLGGRKYGWKYGPFFQEIWVEIVVLYLVMLVCFDVWILQHVIMMKQLNIRMVHVTIQQKDLTVMVIV